MWTRSNEVGLSRFFSNISSDADKYYERIIDAKYIFYGSVILLSNINIKNIDKYLDFINKFQCEYIVCLSWLYWTMCFLHYST